MSESLTARLTRRFAETKFDGGFALAGRGHTRAAAKCDVTHCGRDTAAWYAFGREHGLLSDDQASAMLAAIESLEETDPASPRFGCMRWYAEEPAIEDTNGAFFVQMPLAVLLTVHPECVPDAERETILRILGRGARWFARETERGPMHYPNKILSDGAMTLALARLTGDGALYRAGCAFFARWLRFTREGGWGWGENLSIGYNAVILSAMELARRSLAPGEAEMAAELQSLMDGQLDLFRFFDGHELTPAIRNYNYGGAERIVSPVFNLAGVAGNGLDALPTNVWDAETLLSLFGGALYRDGADYAARGLAHTLPVPRTRVTHVWAENEAVSWIGRGGSLGTLNNFPVYPNCYQHRTWGLGWQCMPLCAAVYGAGVLYARWVVEGDGWVRIHPKHCYLSPALFEGDEPYPAVRTRSRQAGNAALTFRVMQDVDREARRISDEWYIPARAAGAEIREVNGFTCVIYPEAAVLLRPLAGGVIERLTDGDGAIRLRAVRAESADGRVRAAELASGWATVFCDGGAAEAEALARELTVTEETVREPHFRDRAVLARGGEALLAWDFDITEPSTL